MSVPILGLISKSLLRGLRGLSVVSTISRAMGLKTDFGRTVCFPTKDFFFKVKASFRVTLTQS